MTPSKWSERAGWLLSGLVILFMLLDSGMKLVPFDVVITATAALGYPPSPALIRGLGALALTCTAIYAYPRTAVLGAILLTGYMGGAIASHLRLGDPLFSHTLFGFYLGLLVWAGLYLRDTRIRALLPGRASAAEH